MITPKNIKQHLDKYIIKQEEAKTTLALAAYNHLKVKRAERGKYNININKNITLLIGDTGVGKTHLITTLVNELGLRCHRLDMSSITASGWSGTNLDSFTSKLDDEYGVLYLDEIDKIKITPENTHFGAYQKAVQNDLLALLEGEYVNDFKTDRLLIILSGAFVGLDEIVKARVNYKAKPSIGFGSTVEDSVVQSNTITSEDLVAYGLIPELVGRISNIIKMDALEEADLIDILKNTESSELKKHEASFILDGIKIKFSDKFLHTICAESIKKKLGARGLRNELNRHLNPLLYDSIGSGITNITVNDVGDYTKESRVIRFKVKR